MRLEIAIGDLVLEGVSLSRAEQAELRAALGSALARSARGASRSGRHANVPLSEPQRLAHAIAASVAREMSPHWAPASALPTRAPAVPGERSVAPRFGETKGGR